MSIRSAEPADLGRMLELNNAAVPAVNELTADEMAWFLEVAHCCLVAEVPGTPGPSALLVGLDGPSTPYASHNYGWFCGRFDRFLYVDRVVVDPAAHRLGVGRAFYEAFMATAVPTGADPAGTGGHPYLCAEVNTRPPNEESLAFHAAMGFEALGEFSSEGPVETADETGIKTVMMFARRLDS